MKVVIPVLCTDLHVSCMSSFDDTFHIQAHSCNFSFITTSQSGTSSV